MYLLDAATAAFDFSTLDLSTFVPTFMGAVSASIGTVISILAVKKGITWLLGSIRHA